MAQDQLIVMDERGQEQPADKQRAQQSTMEGPAAYAPTNEAQKDAAKTDPAPAGPGDARTPDKPIGEVAYAEKSKVPGSARNP